MICCHHVDLVDAPGEPMYRGGIVEGHVDLVAELFQSRTRSPECRRTSLQMKNQVHVHRCSHYGKGRVCHVKLNHEPANQRPLIAGEDFDQFNRLRPGRAPPARRPRDVPQWPVAVTRHG
jgi:hypothetical protein